MKSHPSLEPYQPTSSDPFDEKKAAHLLNRAGFGARRDEIAAVLEAGPQEAVERLLDFPDAPAGEQSPKDSPDLKSIAGYPTRFSELRSMFEGKSEEERKRVFLKLATANREAVLATGGWWMNRMAYGKYPLQEKLTLFWHGHFTTSARDERAALLMWEQNELLRRNAAGNFHTFVKKISRDPAMLDYLNNQQNHKNHPNENYARELMELFTLGIGHYTEDDIKHAARAFSGWGHDGNQYLFRRFDHDYDEKVFMGRRGKFDGDDIIDIIMQQSACANYIGAKLFKWFAHDDVSPELGQGLGDVLRDAKYELRPLIRTILTSKAFYSPQSIGTQIKSPVQLLVGTVRMLDLEMPDVRRLRGTMEQLGQVPLAPPNVKGWPGGRAWINTSTLFVRVNLGVWLTSGDLPPVRASGAEETVDVWVKRLIQRPIAPEKRQVLVDALGKGTDPQSVQRMVQLIVSMPEFQLC